MKKNALAACLLAAIIFATTSCDNSTPKDTTDAANKQNEIKADSGMIAKNEDDHEFAVNVANAGMAEVKLGELATTNSMNPKVKDYGKMMVKDHGMANDELMALAAKKNITLPAAPDNDHQKTIADMMAKKGKDFDKDYIDGMVKGHEKVEKMMQDEIKDGKDADLKAFATKTLPTIQMHLQMVKSMQDGMKK